MSGCHGARCRSQTIHVSSARQTQSPVDPAGRDGHGTPATFRSLESPCPPFRSRSTSLLPRRACQPCASPARHDPARHSRHPRQRLDLPIQMRSQRGRFLDDTTEEPQPQPVMLACQHWIPLAHGTAVATNHKAANSCGGEPVTTRHKIPP